MEQDYIKTLLKYGIYICIVFLIFLMVKALFEKEETSYVENVITSTISHNDDDTNIYVEYPRFQNDDINKIITNSLYSYIRDFKDNSIKKELNITYNLYYLNEYVNITFNIENSLSNIKNKNILINLNKNTLAYITNIYDEEKLSNEIYNLVYHKYSNEIYQKVKSSTINNFTYLISEDKIDVYFNNIEFENIDYIPYVTIILNSEVSTNVDTDNSYKKYIAFTYDDGPSEYTKEILNTLETNNSSATFFMIGNRMKQNEDIILDIYNSNSEIGSHTYSHKDLKELKDDDLSTELNTTNLIFHNITDDNIKYLRPPYGRFNDSLFNLGYEIILWNLDTKDWLLRDSDKIYNNVIKEACDGCIVLMHDIYPETVEATKKLIPALNELNYEIVSISKLKEIKKYKYSNEAISFIK